MAKKRGGQPNNKNASKHGFYSKHFTQFESKALSEMPLTHVTDVIDLMRVSTARFMEAYTLSLEELDYESRLAALRTISMAAGCIASLVRIQACASKNNERVDGINKSIKEIQKEMEKEEDLAKSAEQNQG